MKLDCNEDDIGESPAVGTATCPDLPPEYCHYQDEGCEMADSCLSCALPQCIYDEPGGRQRWLKKLRDKEIVRIFKGGGRGVKELALMFGVCERTVQRALKKSLPGQNATEKAKGEINYE